MKRNGIPPSKLALAALLAAGFLLRVWTLGYGTNVDEGVYWTEGHQLYEGYMIYRDTQYNKTPLVALVSAPLFLFGDAPVYLMRALMLASGMLALWGSYLLGRELFGERAGLAALALMALEPFSCVWAKYLHTSTWAPWFEIGIFWLLITGLRQGNARRVFLSGVLLGFFALSKQSAIFALPTGLAAWLLFAPERNWARLFKDGAVWTAGIGSVFLPFLAWIAAMGALEAMWFDIWTAHHLMAGAFSHHTLAFRWQEWRSMIDLAPLLWVLPLGSLLLFRGGRWRGLAFAWIWFVVEFVGNILLISHVWRHYFLACMPPLALLAGAFWDWLAAKAANRGAAARADAEGTVNKPFAVSLAALALGMALFYPKNNWTYPGLTLYEERNLSRFILRYCPEPYMLNLANPAYYVWTDKEIPPVYQGDRLTRMPYFMTIAGRGYVTEDDMVRTVELWKTLPIGCVIAYDRFARQIVDDPLMEPVEAWLAKHFEPPRRIAVGESYYGWFFLFESKR